VQVNINHPTKSEIKWQNDFSNIYLNWRSIYSLPFKVTKDQKLVYRIMYRILGINVLLKKINLWTTTTVHLQIISNNKISTYYVKSAIIHVSSADTESDTGELNMISKGTLKAEGLVKSDMDEVCTLGENAPEVHVKLYSDDVIPYPEVSYMHELSVRVPEKIDNSRIGRLKSCYNKW
jgi:hypothetical protein